MVGEGEIERKKKREKRRRMTTISIVGNLLVRRFDFTRTRGYSTFFQRENKSRGTKRRKDRERKK